MRQINRINERIRLAYEHINANLLSKMFYNDKTTREYVRGSLEVFTNNIGINTIICDETNNPPEVIDSNTLIARLEYRDSQIHKYIDLTFGNVEIEWEFNKMKNVKKESSGCPCVHLDEPCSPNCTCKNWMMSGGCYNCAKYGSEEQRKVWAEHINKNRLDKTTHSPINFGRFLLKNCTVAYENGMLTWEYSGENMDTDELFEIFENL